MQIIRNGEVVGLWGEPDQPDPLYNALIDGDLDTARELVQTGADMTFTDTTGWSVFHLIAIENLVDFFQFVLKHRTKEEVLTGLAGSTTNGFTPVNIAMSQGHEDIKQAFISAGAADEADDLTRPQSPPVVYQYNSDEEKQPWFPASSMSWGDPDDNYNANSSISGRNSPVN